MIAAPTAGEQGGYRGFRRRASLLAVLVLLKLGLDVKLHLREHKRLAARRGRPETAVE